MLKFKITLCGMENNNKEISFNKVRKMERWTLKYTNKQRNNRGRAPPDITLISKS